MQLRGGERFLEALRREMLIECYLAMGKKKKRQHLAQCRETLRQRLNLDVSEETLKLLRA